MINDAFVKLMDEKGMVYSTIVNRGLQLYFKQEYGIDLEIFVK
jgi:hypothetical protein